jgi:retron-type reverse transcriptase
MQTAENVLLAMHKLGKSGKPLTRVYRQLFNANLYLAAYNKLRSNEGLMTKGIDDEGVDGFNSERIENIINLMRHERYQFKPARRKDIPKPNGGSRPLGVQGFNDKLTQEIIRGLLEAYYEPQFSDNSHGFRPGRGCHTALQQIREQYKGVNWFIEGDSAPFNGVKD